MQHPLAGNSGWMQMGSTGQGQAAQWGQQRRPGAHSPSCQCYCSVSISLLSCDDLLLCQLWLLARAVESCCKDAGGYVIVKALTWGPTSLALPKSISLRWP